jgi:hypothetical protein
VPAPDTLWADSTLAPSRAYYYRVGAEVLDGRLAWSGDSALARTPAPGPPHAPDSLLVHVRISRGVTLSWLDLSRDEQGFELQRAPSGGFFRAIDSVAANVISYTDSLRDTLGVYYYRIRAFNSYGTSSWELSDAANYDYRSEGVIPLCPGNWWRYAITRKVNDVEMHYDSVRGVLDYGWLGENDYYGLGVRQLFEQENTRLNYQRNFEGLGCVVTPAPLDPQAIPSLLYKWPLPVVGAHWTVEEGAAADCVVVLQANGTVSVSGTTYHGVAVYERFRDRYHFTQIFIMPETVGIVREIDFSHADTVAVRELVGYDVRR